MYSRFKLILCMIGRYNQIHIVNACRIATKLEIREKSGNFTKFSGKLKFLALKKFNMRILHICTVLLANVSFLFNRGLKCSTKNIIIFNLSTFCWNFKFI